MQACGSGFSESELASGVADDVPPPPLTYDQYLQRMLNDSTRAAYARGYERGAKHELMMLLIGLVLGFALGFFTAMRA